jgi:hypothetical protein
VADIRVIPPLSGDYAPDQFTFVDQIDVAISSTVTSAPITITGVSPGTVISVSLDTGLWSKDGVTFVSGPGNVILNDQVYLRHIASGSGTTQTSQTLTIGGVQGTFTSTTVSAAGLVGVSDPTLSTNLGGIADWSTDLVFIDLIQMSRPWAASPSGTNWDGLFSGGYLDADGWPLSIPPGDTSVGTYWGARPGGNYLANESMTLTWEGTATVSLGGGGSQNVVQVNSNTITFNFGSAGITEGLNFSITSMGAAPNNPRNFRLIRDKFQALYDAGERINPDYIQSVQDFRLLRFMTWTQTNRGNQIPMAPSKSWEWTDMSTHANRVTFSNFGNDLQVNHGPVKDAVDICNKVKADPWFCFIHYGSDDYITQFATYVRDNLDPSLVAHFELSNEIWNSGSFNHFAYFLNEGRTAWPGASGDSDPEVAYSAAGKRIYEAALLVDAVYAGIESRRVNVMGTQGWDVPSSPDSPLNLQGNAAVWQAQDPGNYVQPASVCQAAAIAPYYGTAFTGFWDEDPVIAARMSEFVTQYQAGTHLEWFYDWLTDPANDGSIQNTASTIEITHNDAAALGLELLQYEGMRHYLHGNFWFGFPSGADGLAGMLEFARSEQDAMCALQMWNEWEKWGNGPLQVFAHIGEWSGYGAWTHSEFYGDDSPYKEMLFTLNAYTPNWWGGTGDYRGQVIQGATDYSTPIGDSKPLITELVYGVLGHSIFTHTAPPATPWTATGEWLGRLAATHERVCVGAHSFGQYGPPGTNWNSLNWTTGDADEITGAYDLGNTEVWPVGRTWVDPAMTQFLSMPSNFIEADTPAPPNYINPTAQAYLVDQISQLIDNINITHGDLPHAVMIHYPESAYTVVNVTNLRSDLTDANNLVMGPYHDYMIRVQDDVVATGRTNVRFFPIGAIKAWLLENHPALTSLLFNDLYYDEAPHGRETIHLLQAMIFHRCWFGQSPDWSNFTIPAGATEVRSELSNNLVSIDAAIQGRIDFHRANGVRV